MYLLDPSDVWMLKSHWESEPLLNDDVPWPSPRGEGGGGGVSQQSFSALFPPSASHIWAFPFPLWLLLGTCVGDVDNLPLSLTQDLLVTSVLFLFFGDCCFFFLFLALISKLLFLSKRFVSFTTEGCWGLLELLVRFVFLEADCFALLGKLGTFGAAF